MSSDLNVGPSALGLEKSMKTESNRYKSKPRPKLPELSGYSTPVAEATLPYRKAKYNSIGPSNRSIDGDFHPTDAESAILNQETNVIGITHRKPVKRPNPIES